MKKTYKLYPRNKISTSSLGTFYFPPKKPVNSFSPEINNNNNDTSRRKSFNKSQKIIKMIEDLNFSSLKTLKNCKQSNNIYGFQKLLLEEKIKNKNLTENIILLNKHIDDLECRLNKNCCQNNNNNLCEELIQLKQENQELKLFKERVYSLSMKYDELNINIINSLKSIEKIVEIINNCSSQNFFCENEKIKEFNKISNNYKSIIDNLTIYMNIKQDEYNMLLLERENEIEKLKNNLGDGSNSNYCSPNYKINSKVNMNMNRTFICSNRKNCLKDFGNQNQSQNQSCSFNKTCDFNFGKNEQKNIYKNKFDIY